MSTTETSMDLKIRALSISVQKPISSTLTPNKQRKPRRTRLEKIYTATGQAPSPSRDFFELIVAKDLVIWRAWRIKYRKDGRVVPTEQKLSYEDFQVEERLHREIAGTLGEDVLNLALGYVSKQWFIRLPQPIFLKILSFLDYKAVSSLSKVFISAIWIIYFAFDL